MNDPDLARHYVQQGFDWIKEHGAEYDIQLDRIDPATLSINDPDLCILAQASGRPFEEILYAIYLDGAHDRSTTWLVEHGFVSFDHEEIATQHWLYLIARDAAAAE